MLNSNTLTGLTIEVARKSDTAGAWVTTNLRGK